jgi:CRP-like cAMP-binding protein
MPQMTRLYRRERSWQNALLSKPRQVSAIPKLTGHAVAFLSGSPKQWLGCADEEPCDIACPGHGEGSRLVRKNRNRLLASLRPSDISLLSRYLREVPIEQGEMLEERGKRVDVVHFPQTGMVSLIVAMPEDHSVEVGSVGSEGAVGLTAGLGSRIGSVSALVQVSGTSLCIAASRFRTAATQSQHIRDLIIRYSELQIGQIQQTAACNALHDIASRMSRWLLQTSDKIEDDTVPFTREFLGEMLGVHRGTISLVATQFEAAGLIHTHRGNIKLLDKKGLKNEACACYEIVRRHIDRLLPKLPDH